MDKGEKIEVILTDLSKAFGAINYSLLLAKLDGYCFSRASLKLMQNYLCNRQQRISINGSFSDWTEAIAGFPQGSILGPLLFTIFSDGIFMFISKCNLLNYGDDNTVYSTGKELNWIRRNLEMDFMILHQWFHKNHMILNPGKCHYMVIGNWDLSHEIMLNNNKITSSNEGMTHSLLLPRLDALSWLKNYLTSDQRNLLLNSVIKSQLTYYPLTWMFTTRYLNNALNNIH